MTRPFVLTDTRDMHGRPITIGGTAHPRTHTHPAALELDVTVGTQTATVDVATAGGREIVADLIASLQAALELGAEIGDAGIEVLDRLDEPVADVEIENADDDGDDGEDDEPILRLVQ